jgi:two-component system, OmpR family, response regulator
MVEVDMSTRSRRLLLVEDSEDVRESLALLLELEGHRVRTASTATAALDMARQELPEVALIDLGLPDLDGCELARRLRDLPGSSGVMLVALTGFAGGEVEARCQDAGFATHLVKPVEFQALQSVLA